MKPLNPDISYFAKTNFRNEGKLFGIKQSDRLFHLYCTGMTGTGKSSLLKTLISQDIEYRRGCLLLEPHGDLTASILASIPESDKGRLVYLDATDPNVAIGYNPFRKVTPHKRPLVAAGILDVLKKQFLDTWGSKLEYILRYTILALLDQPEAHFGRILDMLLDKEYRREAKRHIEEATVLEFWEREFPKYLPYDLLPILNKIGGIISHKVVRKVLIENKDRISLRSVMDKGQILLVNIAKGHIGSDASHILGALLLTSITSAAFSRVDTVEEERKPFYVYVDEVQNYASLSLIDMLSELRKFKVGVIMAHQYLDQLELDIQNAIFGNVGTKITFRVGYRDAAVWAKEMYPYFKVEDFMQLANYAIYLVLMIDGVPSKPFSAVTIDAK